jgi:type II secretory pathway predicted ATPase ExeA
MPTPTTNSGLDLRQLAARGERVFPSYPQVARYFPAAAIEDARQRLSRTIDRGDGPGLVVGAPGTGKSLLLQVLAAQYHERFDVVLLAATRICTCRALLQAILFELGLPYRLRDEGQLRLSLLDHLLSAEESPAGLLLLVDEAQALSLVLLDELRVMTNLVRGGAPRVRVVLAGSAALEESFAQPELESFSQRLSSRCYLAPFNRNETCQFIRAQVAASGGAPDLIFTADAANAVFDATDGIPRLVSQLCDRALLLAEVNQLASVDSNAIQSSWADLQQLPTPWDNPTQCSTQPSVTQIIEFGGLNTDEPTAAAAFVEVIEPTELDAEDTQTVEVAPPPANEPVDAIPCQRPEPVPGDPFAEKFDEEEIVLDTFAAWDDMFHRATPRVENRRDPQFASLVQAAIDASPVVQATHARKVDSHADVFGDMDEFVDENADDNPAADAAEEESSVDPSADWPPLRLAIVSEPVPLKPIPLVAPNATTVTGTSAFDPVFPEDADAVDGWSTQVAAPLALTPRPTKKYDITSAAALPSAEPILIIEDDLPATPTGKPPVRREEYRHLFSRLRSG